MSDYQVFKVVNFELLDEKSIRKFRAVVTSRITFKHRSFLYKTDDSALFNI
jgi:hypothetical protein